MNRLNHTVPCDLDIINTKSYVKRKKTLLRLWSQAFKKLGKNGLMLSVQLQFGPIVSIHYNVVFSYKITHYLFPENPCLIQQINGS